MFSAPTRRHRRLPWLPAPAAALAVAAACGVLAACGGGAAGGTGSGPALTLYSGQHPQTTQALVKEGARVLGDGVPKIGLSTGVSPIPVSVPVSPGRVPVSLEGPLSTVSVVVTVQPTAPKEAYANAAAAKKPKEYFTGVRIKNPPSE